MKSKGFTVLALLLIVFLVISVITVSYLYSVNKNIINEPVREGGADDFTNPNFTPTTIADDEVNEIPDGWLEKEGVNCPSIFSIPPRKAPYVLEGRFWDFPRGSVYPKMLSKLGESYVQDVTMFATPDESSGFTYSWVMVACMETDFKSLDQMVENLEESIIKYNQNNDEQMEADTYTIKSAKKSNRWGMDTIELTVDEYYKNSGGDPFTKTNTYYLFIKNNMLYEVSKFGYEGGDKFVQETKDKIFDNLRFK